MYYFDRFIIDFFKIFDCFVSKKYITEANRFIKERKMNQKDCMVYILSQRGCTGLYWIDKIFHINDEKKISRRFQVKQLENKECSSTHRHSST